jgi:hypothetical protein
MNIPSKEQFTCAACGSDYARENGRAGVQDVPPDLLRGVYRRTGNVCSLQGKAKMMLMKESATPAGLLSRGSTARCAVFRKLAKVKNTLTPAQKPYRGDETDLLRLTESMLDILHRIYGIDH